MDKKQMIEIFEVLTSAFPKFYEGANEEDYNNAINLWFDCFRDDDYGLVSAAVYSAVTTCKFAPTIAEIKELMYKLTDTSQTAIEYWHCIKKALSNSSYGASKEFEQLPDICKRFVGSPRQLYDWGTSTTYNDDVVRSNFLNQFEKIKKQEKEQKMLPKKYKKMIDDLRNNLSLQ